MTWAEYLEQFKVMTPKSYMNLDDIWHDYHLVWSEGDGRFLMKSMRGLPFKIEGGRPYRDTLNGKPIVIIPEVCDYHSGPRYAYIVRPVFKVKARSLAE